MRALRAMARWMALFAMTAFVAIRCTRPRDHRKGDGNVSARREAVAAILDPSNTHETAIAERSRRWLLRPAPIVYDLILCLMTVGYIGHRLSHDSSAISFPTGNKYWVGLAGSSISVAAVSLAFRHSLPSRLSRTVWPPLLVLTFGADLWLGYLDIVANRSYSIFNMPQMPSGISDNVNVMVVPSGVGGFVLASAIGVALLVFTGRGLRGRHRARQAGHLLAASTFTALSLSLFVLSSGDVSFSSSNSWYSGIVGAVGTEPISVDASFLTVQSTINADGSGALYGSADIKNPTKGTNVELTLHRPNWSSGNFSYLVVIHSFGHGSRFQLLKGQHVRALYLMNGLCDRSTSVTPNSELLYGSTTTGSATVIVALPKDYKSSVRQGGSIAVTLPGIGPIHEGLSGSFGANGTSYCVTNDIPELRNLSWHLPQSINYSVSPESVDTLPVYESVSNINPPPKKANSLSWSTDEKGQDPTNLYLAPSYLVTDSSTQARTSAYIYAAGALAGVAATAFMGAFSVGSKFDKKSRAKN